MAHLQRQMVQSYIGGRGKKLWDIRDGFQCSVIGTCLSEEELKKINQKKEVRGGHFSSSYELHNRFVRLAQYDNAASEAMQKILNGKYRVQVVRFHKAKKEQELRDLWQSALEKGEIAGAYWAVCSHPTLSQDILSDFYGDVHMKSHDSVRGLEKTRKVANALQLKNIQLESELEQLQQKHLQSQQELQRTIQHLEKQLLFEKKTKQQDNKSNGRGLAHQSDQHSQQIEFVRLQQMLAKVHGELLQKQSEVELRDELNAQLELKNSLLQANLKSHKDEVFALEMSLERLFASNNCGDCEKAETTACPGKQLCGKRVLYVGGMHNLIPHYRQLVERNGGEFLHHDGGREESTNRLPAMLAQADAVMCPVDCVSHDACLTVKKICKQYHKPYVMMRSSGLSSLAHGLDRILA